MNNNHKFSFANFESSYSCISHELLLAFGANLQDAGQLRQAEKIYRKVLKNDPSCAPARYRLGILYFLKERCYDAIKLIDSATILQPGNPIYYISLAIVLIHNKRIGEADFSLRKGLLLLLNNPINCQKPPSNIY